MTPKTIKDKKAALAERAGVAEENVGAVRLQLQKLQQEGVLVDVDFHGGHVFTTRATYQVLGIPHGDVRRQRIRAGSKTLIPVKYLKRLRSLETRFRQGLDKYGFQIGAFGDFFWRDELGSHGGYLHSQVVSQDLEFIGVGSKVSLTIHFHHRPNAPSGMDIGFH